MSDCTVRAELHAQTLQQIPNIQSLLLYLKRKGRSKNTIRACKHNLLVLSKRADLSEPKVRQLMGQKKIDISGVPALACRRLRRMVRGENNR